MLHAPLIPAGRLNFPYPSSVTTWTFTPNSRNASVKIIQHLLNQKSRSLMNAREDTIAIKSEMVQWRHDLHADCQCQHSR